MLGDTNFGGGKISKGSKYFIYPGSGTQPGDKERDQRVRILAEENMKRESSLSPKTRKVKSGNSIRRAF